MFTVTNNFRVCRHRTDVSLLQEELIAAVPGHTARGQCPQLLQLSVRHQVPGEEARSHLAPGFFFFLFFPSDRVISRLSSQNAALQPATNGQTPLSANNAVQLKCNYCRGAFSLKPEILEWEVRKPKNGKDILPPASVAA